MTMAGGGGRGRRVVSSGTSSLASALMSISEKMDAASGVEWLDLKMARCFYL